MINFSGRLPKSSSGTPTAEDVLVVDDVGGCAEEEGSVFEGAGFSIFVILGEDVGAVALEVVGCGCVLPVNLNACKFFRNWPEY
jgi:hypothetical protein